MYQKIIKLSNEKKVFSFIFNQMNNFTVLDIGEALNITFPTVKRVIDIFLEKNIIHKQEKVGNSVGRKSLTYSYNQNCFYSIGIKISYENIEIVLSNTKGVFLKKAILPFKIESEGLFNTILSELNSFFHDIDPEIKKVILGIGISIPGIVISERQIIEIKEGVNIPIEALDEIKNSFNLPVFIENESNLSSITEVFLNYFYKFKLLDIVTVNETIGMTTLYMEEGLNSFYFRAGKINHMVVAEKSGKKCSCGNIGCLGLYTGENVLIEDFRNHFPEINSYSDIFLKGYAKTDIGKEILSNHITYFAIGLKNLIVFSNPEKIIISGRISRYKEYVEKELLEKVYATGNFYRDKNIIVFSDYYEDSSLIGAALFPIVDILF